MSRATPGIDAKYKLIPQAYSDSELSEEEIQSIIQTHGFQIILKNRIRLDDTSSLDQENGTLKTNYQPLESMERSQNTRTSSTSTKTQPGGSPKNELYYVKPMSNLRKIAFISSIFICISTVIIFLWIVPCGIETCPAKLQLLSTTSWEKLLIDLEIKGAITIIEGSWDRDQNLLFMLRGSLWKKLHVPLRGDNFPPQGGGLVSLISSNGALAWPSYRRLNNPPTDIDCALIDTDNDGVNECIVTGKAFIAAVSPIKGETKWRYPSLSTLYQSKDIDFEFPVILPDLNGDKVPELATISCDNQSSTTDNHNKYQLLIISGSDGSVKLIENKDCVEMSNLGFDLSQITLLYVCKLNSNDEKTATLNLSDVFKSTNAININRSSYTLKQHERIIFHKNYTVGEHTLTVENHGTPPFDCFVNITVMDSKGKVFWRHFSELSTVMIPVTIQFKNSVSGFLLKVWEWLPSSQVEETSKDHFAVRKVRENVILIVFNGTGNLHVVSASQSDITQLCYAKQCQPDHQLQGQSMLLSDLNQDGLQELVSYQVTFVNLKEGESSMGFLKKSLDSDWQLQSKVQVIHLEAELPKLYENRSNQLTSK
ncbi:unnamed protein product [Bemisia tabaci]|uniref:Uncharacterized protein n=1 Tax=Bemisia tabaci TaxID=7038 RepID=A0A9P0ALH0_BEMTA|nr:PREDICTED: uncharacterized protein LOC109034060 [Bemisia tabaci]CAH0393226.1 unnamed protein product [Bemisia tabaci]